MALCMEGAEVASSPFDELVLRSWGSGSSPIVVLLCSGVEDKGREMSSWSVFEIC